MLRVACRTCWKLSGHCILGAPRDAARPVPRPRRCGSARYPHPWEPEFQAGDVLFFDHRFLHRTHLKLGQWRTRYSIESWFFAPSVYADDPTTALVV